LVDSFVEAQNNLKRMCYAGCVILLNPSITAPISQPITSHATNSGGNISSQSFWLIFGSASGIHALVSNRSPHLVQVQRLRTKRSLTNSDQSGAISASPHLTHVVVMATLLRLFLFLFSASRVG